MNKIVLMGYLSKMPELHTTEGEKPVTITRFDLAVNRKGKSKENSEADFFHCTAFGKTAEFIEKYFDKGSRMLLTGRVENNNYTNKQGEKVYGYQVLVEEVEFGDSKSSVSKDQGETNE
ncbi:MAG: single-stranded DNA-binding protein [Lachnospiraceae bacterium]|nr:single-stranded DNA-binding protein [Lachnospiraceae bacterium]